MESNKLLWIPVIFWVTVCDVKPPEGLRLAIIDWSHLKDSKYGEICLNFIKSISVDNYHHQVSSRSFKKLDTNKKLLFGIKCHSQTAARLLSNPIAASVKMTSRQVLHKWLTEKEDLCSIIQNCVSSTLYSRKNVFHGVKNIILVVHTCSLCCIFW